MALSLRTLLVIRAKLRPLIYFQCGGYKGPLGKETLPGNVWSLIIFYLTNAESLQKSGCLATKEPSKRIMQAVCMLIRRTRATLDQPAVGPCGDKAVPLPSADLADKSSCPLLCYYS